MLAAVVPGGLILDLQTVRPPPRVEAEGRVLCELETAEFFARADANEAILMASVREGVLALETEEYLEVLQRWPCGAELVADLQSRLRKIPGAMLPVVGAIAGECVIREPCRTRRLRKMDL